MQLWNPIDTRLPNDTKALKYSFEVTGNRCKKIESSKIQVKNPKVISMEWDKKALYYGDKATLKIKTFELSDEKPSCKLQLWEQELVKEGIILYEKEITIKQDEIEIEIEFNFSLQDLNLTENHLELFVFTKLLLDNKKINIDNVLIRVGVGFIYG